MAKFIFQQLPRKEKYRLAIDRTNWQFGKTDINIYMLAVIHDGVAYPLLFSMLPKKGTSTRRSASTSCNATSTSSEGRPSTAFSPRYFIRIRENFWTFNPKSGSYVKVFWIFNHLKDGEADFFRHIFYVKGQECYLSGSRIK